MLLKLNRMRFFTKSIKSRKSIQINASLLYCSESRIIKPKNTIEENLEKKVKVWMKTYEDLFGITRLSEMHEKVLEHQNKVQVTQEKRRRVQEEIFIVQKKLQEMQDILHKTSMGDDMYISVVTQVRELLKEQKRLQDVFSLYDQTEKEQQTTLALSINNSQDQERTYREKNKYLSLITGIVGGVLGILGSSINNWRHRKDIKSFANDILSQVVDLQKTMDRINSMFTADKHLLNVAEGEAKMKDLESAVKLQHEILNETVKKLQNLLNQKYNVSEHHENYSSGLSIEEILNNYETNLDSKLRHYSSLNIGLISIIILGFFIYLKNQ
ncbi:uncharacterized protein LOC129225994 [Uloborus diversus]|uniref:uncharacterized protein LOC129225994 n=1 Tax=Uloborus diversus TaxID=327109 RepID=UPI002409BDFD|nr:uncharacterized protein LOC129225994 [Uloborus diversus]